MVFAIDFGTGMVTCGVSNEDRGQVWWHYLGFLVVSGSKHESRLSSSEAASIWFCSTRGVSLLSFNLNH